MYTDIIDNSIINVYCNVVASVQRAKSKAK